MHPYLYTITPTPGEGYKPTLHRGDDKPLIQIGAFKRREDAEAACRAHYLRACDFLARMGKPVPEASFN